MTLPYITPNKAKQLQGLVRHGKLTKGQFITKS